MADPNGESPLDLAVGAGGSRAAEAFTLLADETRLAILLALWDAYEPFAGGGGMSFTDLRKRVGVADSGQFNYHLGKLEGHFIESTDAGYKLRPAGEKLTRAVIGGAGLETPAMDPTPIDIPCPKCGGATTIAYRDGRLFHACTECSGHFDAADDLPSGTLFTWRFEPAGLADRSPEEVFAAAWIGMGHRAVLLSEGVCPECSGRVESSLEVCEDHRIAEDGVCAECSRQDEVLALFQCGVCKFSGGAAPADLVSHHPAVVGFYHDRDIDVQYHLEFADVVTMLEAESRHEQVLESRDPDRIRVTVRDGDDEVSLLLDETLEAIEIQR